MLPEEFPFKEIFDEFLEEYAACPTLWYVPKWRVLDDDNFEDFALVLHVIDEEFSDEPWGQDVQDELLDRLREEEVLSPRTEGDERDRTALPRILKKQLEMLGLLWVPPEQEAVVTKAGTQLRDRWLENEPLRPVIARQVAKMQYPNPSVAADYNSEFQGILPHIFLLQLLDELDHITYDELVLFVNLAQSQDDLARIQRYILTWRELEEDEQDVVRNFIEPIPMADVEGDQIALGDDFEPPEDATPRVVKVGRDADYQRWWFSAPSYLTYNPQEGEIRVTDEAEVRQQLHEHLEDLKIPEFDTVEDWIEYHGDPEQEPSWFNYLTFRITVADTREEAEEEVEEHREELDEEEQEEIERLQIEKGIEEFYVDRLGLIEEGLELYENEEQDGQQFVTPIGRIDLLCTAPDGTFVVIEIKAEEAGDSVFGQIQRYMGWVHRNLNGGGSEVRGIVLAKTFPDKARYSRIGLLKDNHEDFIQFVRHGIPTDT